MQSNSTSIQTTGGFQLQTTSLRFDPYAPGRISVSFLYQCLCLTIHTETSCVFYGDLYPNDEGYDVQIAVTLARMMEARKIFAYGHQEDFFERPNVIAWTRAGDVQREGCIVVVCSCAQKKETIRVSAKFVRISMYLIAKWRHLLFFFYS
jgi:hypothetical protein